MSNGFVRLMVCLVGMGSLPLVGCIKDQQVRQRRVTKAKPTPTEITECLKLGRASKRLPLSAVNICQKARQIAPSRAAIWLALSHIYQHREAWKEAAFALKKARQLGTDHPARQVRQVRLYTKAGLYQQAVDVLGWKQMPPKWRLMLLRKMGKQEQAEHYAHQLLARRPKQPGVYRQLLLMYESQGKLRKALLVGTIGLQIVSPHDPDLHNNVGVLLLKLKQEQRAIYHFKKALAIDTHHRNALYNLGCYYQAQGYWRLAEPQWVKFLKASATPGARRQEVLRLYGRLLLKRRKLRAAQAVFQQLLKQQSKDPEALFQMGVSFFLQKEVKSKRLSLLWFKKFLAQPKAKKLPQYKESLAYIKQAKARLAVLSQ